MMIHLYSNARVPRDIPRPLRFVLYNPNNAILKLFNRGSMYTNFVFDVDGTIINSECAWNRIIRQALKKYLGRRITATDLKAIRGMPDDLMFKYFQIIDPVAQASILSSQREIYPSEYGRNSYYHGTIECIDLLRSQGLAVGVVTNRLDFELQEPLWIQLVSKIDVIVTGEMVTMRKPDPEPLNLYLKLAQAERSKVLFIGDTGNDAECSERAGVDFALSMWGTHSPDLKAKYKLSHPKELERYYR